MKSVDWSRAPVALGDVLVLADGEEVWLAGVTAFDEDATVLALFRAPRQGGDRAVVVRLVAPFEVSLYDALVVEEGPAEPPTSLEHAGSLYRRVRRLPLHAERAGGEQFFPCAGASIVGEYQGAGSERVFRVGAQGQVFLFVGRKLSAHEYDRLPAPSGASS